MTEPQLWGKSHKESWKGKRLVNCTPEQCAELKAMLLVLQAELIVIQAEAVSTQGLIETVQACLDYCDCDQVEEDPVPLGREKTSLTPELQERMKMLPFLQRMFRNTRPNAPTRIG